MAEPVVEPVVEPVAELGAGVSEMVNSLEREVENNVSIICLEDKSKIYEGLVTEGLEYIKKDYSLDLKINEGDIVGLITKLMSFMGTKKTLEGGEKKQVVLMVIKLFFEKSGLELSKYQSLIEKSIDFAVKLSKEKTIKIKKDKVVDDIKKTFNDVYGLLCSEIESKYPQADDVINNIFDICNFVVKNLDRYKNLSSTQKKSLFKNILLKLVDTADKVIPAITDEQIKLLRENIDGVSEIGLIAVNVSNGKLTIEPEQVNSLINCILRCFRK